MAELALEDEIYNQTCFHSQQGAEKALKAVTYSTGIMPPKIHIVTELLKMIPDNVRSTMPLNVTKLDDFYIPTRYPDALPGALPDGLPGHTDAVEALKWASETLEAVELYFSEQAEDDIHKK